MRRFSSVPFNGTKEQEQQLTSWLEQHKDMPGAAMPALQKAQEIYGYLPIEPEERARKLRQLEQRIYNEHQTQLFIETPYRNNKMMEDILRTCRPQTRLCIAANITCEGEYIRTRTVREWQGRLPDLSKIPCIFLLYK